MRATVVTRKSGKPSDDKTTMLVRKIPDGSVIDHIAAGKALSVLRLLGNPQENGFTIALVANVSSSKMGRKDIVKVEGTDRKLEWDNGWGYWQMSFAQWQQGSALK